MTSRSPEFHAAWIRLAQAVSIADRVAAPAECETTIQVSQAMLGMSTAEIVAAKAAAMDLPVAAAVDLLKSADLKARQRVILGLVNVAFADGKFRSVENKVLSAIAVAIDLDLDTLVQSFRAARMLVPVDEITANASVLQ